NALDPSFNGGGFDGFIAKFDTTQTGANSLLWSTYLGGNQNENIFDVAVDIAGNIHVVGGTQSTDFPQVSPVSTLPPFLTQPFVSIISAAGNSLIFSSYWGNATNGQTINAVAVNTRGDTFIGGVTNSNRTNPPLADGLPLVNPFQNTY